MKGSRPIIPPGKLLLLRMKDPEEVSETPLPEPLKTFPFLSSVKDLALQTLFIPAVEGCRTEVEVTAKNY